MQDTDKIKENLLKIEEKISKYLKQYNNKFDTVAYTQIAIEHLKANASLENLDVSVFINKDNNSNNKNDSTYNNNNNRFQLIKDGDNFVAVGLDGTILDGNNFEELNDKVCQHFVQKNKAKGKETIINFQSPDPENLKIFSRNAIMKFGITVGNGYVNDSKFWQNLKNEYLSVKNHSLQDWERMTRLIPDNVMQRTEAEKKRNQQLIKELDDKKTSNTSSNLIEQLRKGSNPNLAAPTPQRKNIIPQKLVIQNILNQSKVY